MMVQQNVATQMQPQFSGSAWGIGSGNNSGGSAWALGVSAAEKTTKQTVFEFKTELVETLNLNGSEEVLKELADAEETFKNRSFKAKLKQAFFLQKPVEHDALKQAKENVNSFLKEKGVDVTFDKGTFNIQLTTDEAKALESRLPLAYKDNYPVNILDTVA